MSGRLGHLRIGRSRPWKFSNMSLLGISLALFATVQNIDNLVVATAYRLKNASIPIRSNLVISLLSGVATGVPAVIAIQLRSEAVHIGLNTSMALIGRGILFMLGVWSLCVCLRPGLFQRLKTPASCGVSSDSRQTQSSKGVRPIRAGEAFVVGLALAVDNIGPSFAFGAIDPIRPGFLLSGVMLAATTAGVSVVAVAWGQTLGQKARARSQYLLPAFLTPELIAGFLFIALAIVPIDTDDLFTDFLKLRMKQL